MPTSTPEPACGPDLSCDEVWDAIDHASFAVLSHVAPSGEPRSSGVVFATDARRIYVAVDPAGWKARQVRDGSVVSMVVTVRRGGLLSLVFPIPPATITFRARVRVLALRDLDQGTLPASLAKLVPPDRAANALVFELAPEGRFVTFGIGVPLMRMRDPAASRALVPVA
jgi:hypothetical protein